MCFKTQIKFRHCLIDSEISHIFCIQIASYELVRLRKMLVTLMESIWFSFFGSVRLGHENESKKESFELKITCAWGLIRSHRKCFTILLCDEYSKLATEKKSVRETKDEFHCAQSMNEWNFMKTHLHCATTYVESI